MLTNLFECELAYINIDHPSFIGMRAAWQEIMERRDGPDVTSDGDASNGHMRVHRSSVHQPSRSRSSHAQPRHHAVCFVSRSKGLTAMLLGHRASGALASSRPVLVLALISSCTDLQSPVQALLQAPEHPHSASQSSIVNDDASAADGEESDQPGWLSSLFPGRRMHDARADETHSASPTAAVVLAGAAGTHRDGFASVLASRPATNGMQNGPYLPSAPATLVSRVLRCAGVLALQWG
jgi:hypothetical protein